MLRPFVVRLINFFIEWFGLTRLSWRIYDCVLRMWHGRSSRSDIIIVDHLPEALLSKCLPAISSGREIFYKPDDHVIGYTFSPDPAIEEGLKDRFSWVALEGEVITAVEVIWSTIKSRVETELGSPIEIVNAKIMRLKSSAGQFGPTAWHNDNFPLQFFKVLVYLTTTMLGSGDTKIRLNDGSTLSINGPCGKWVLFNPTRYYHCGTPPEEHDRVTIELTIVRRLRTRGACLSFGGTNSAYPQYPWTQLPRVSR